MYSLLVVADESKPVEGLCSELDRSGFLCTLATYGEGVVEHVLATSPEAILIEMNGRLAESSMELCREMKQVKDLPIIALVNRESLHEIDGNSEINDFVLEPYDLKELLLRVKRALKWGGDGNSGEVIQCGDLLIDIDRREVFVSGRRVMLTFREYELLKFLASNSGRVFTRDALLNKVWGYDYYGGDRTVDVHIRRLRSKIEDSHRTSIETVRNIGYRFRENIESL